jgi:hypothetical protein
MLEFFLLWKKKIILGFSYPFTLLTISHVCVCVCVYMGTNILNFLTSSPSFPFLYYVNIEMQESYTLLLTLIKFWGWCGQKKKNHVYKNQGQEPIHQKNHVYKNQGRESIHQRYVANESTSKHNPEKKQKQTIDKSKVKILFK